MTKRSERDGVRKRTQQASVWYVDTKIHVCVDCVALRFWDVIGWVELGVQQSKKGAQQIY